MEYYQTLIEAFKNIETSPEDFNYIIKEFQKTKEEENDYIPNPNIIKSNLNFGEAIDFLIKNKNSFMKLPNWKTYTRIKIRENFNKCFQICFEKHLTIDEEWILFPFSWYPKNEEVFRDDWEVGIDIE